MTDQPELQIDLSQYQLPHFIAVEGAIGVGKTTLAKRLAQTFNYDVVLEQTKENPFLEKFYRDPRHSALPTQLFFLFQRAQQLRDLKQDDLFQPVRVSDFLMEKDQLFAEITLDDDELKLYQQVYDKLTFDSPRPDLVIYLQAPTEVLMQRVKSRGVAAEQLISYEYLNRLNDGYMRFFHFYDSAPLLIVNATDLDLVSNPDHYHQLVDYLLNIKSGRHYYNPTPKV